MKFIGGRQGFSQGAVQHSWEQRTTQHPKQLTCRTSQICLRRPEHGIFCSFSPPFGMPQPRGSKPSASSPSYKSPSYTPCHDWLPSLMCCQRGSWCLWAAEDPQGSEHLLHSKAAVLLPRSVPFLTHSPTEVGFSHGHEAGRAEPHPLELLECPLRISSGLQNPH